MVSRVTREKWVVDNEPVALVVFVYSRRLLGDSEQPGHDFAIRFESCELLRTRETCIDGYFCFFLSQVSAECFSCVILHLPVLVSLIMYQVPGIQQ